jgi:hypothetical protein
VTSSVTFVSQAALDARPAAALGVAKRCCAVENTRGGIGKASMIHNDATPHDRGRSRNLRGPRRRRTAHLRAGDGAADGAALFPVLILYDHVIGHMLEHLGARVSKVSLPFHPEGGAYGGAHQGHSHGPEDHDHGH